MSFQIQHTWGDPREPEYRNGTTVSFAHYKEDGIHLFFSMFPLNPDGSGPFVLEVPRDIRILLGNDWKRCEVAIQRVVEYLEALDESITYRKYSGIVLDTSKVTTWLPTQIKLFEQSHPFLVDSLPDVRTLPFIALGFAIAFQSKFTLFENLGTESLSTALLAVGIVILGILLSDIYTRWAYCVLMSRTVFQSWSTLDILQGMFSRYWRRYLVTLCFSILAICDGLK